MRINSVEDLLIRFRTNWEGYIRQYRVLLALTVLAAIADAASTIYFMLQAGPDAESHPADLIRFRAHTRAYIWQAVPANRDRCFDGLSSSVGALYLRGCYHPLRLGGMV